MNFALVNNFTTSLNVKSAHTVLIINRLVDRGFLRRVDPICLKISPFFDLRFLAGCFRHRRQGTVYRYLSETFFQKHRRENKNNKLSYVSMKLGQ